MRIERIKSRPFRLRKLRSQFERQIFAVPKLQREFVWNPRKACQLLDSVFRNYPVGSAMIWRARRKQQFALTSQRHILPPYGDHNAQIWFVIDGQQRLSVLWQLLRGSGHEVKTQRRQTIDFSKFYFYVGPTEQATPFVYRKRAPAENHVAVVDLLSSRWRSRLGHLGKRAFIRAAECRERILNYELWLTFIDGSNLDDVQETFIRINSLGTPVAAADKAFARATSLDLRNSVRAVQDRLGQGFANVREQPILTAIALALGAGDIGDRANELMIRRAERDQSERRRFEKVWKDLSKAVPYAVDYMSSNFGVSNYAALPSDYLLTMLSLFFLYRRNRRPSRTQRKALRRWFWSTIVGSRYTGRGYRPNLLADARMMKRLAMTGRVNQPALERQPERILYSTDYRRRGMLPLGLFCLLRTQCPRYLEDGEVIPGRELAAAGNRHDKHHIFPKHALNRCGISATSVNALTNICFLVARENQRVGSSLPRTYLQDVPQGRRHVAATLASHLIPSGAEAGLHETNTKRGFRMFTQARSRLLARAFEREAGVRLFDRNR